MSEPTPDGPPQRWLSVLEHDERVALIRANLLKFWGPPDKVEQQERASAYAEEYAQDAHIEGLTLSQLKTITTTEGFSFSTYISVWEEHHSVYGYSAEYEEFTHRDAISETFERQVERFLDFGYGEPMIAAEGWCQILRDRGQAIARDATELHDAVVALGFDLDELIEIALERVADLQ